MGQLVNGKILGRAMGRGHGLPNAKPGARIRRLRRKLREYEGYQTQFEQMLQTISPSNPNAAR